jgi:hypothetical protein
MADSSEADALFRRYRREGVLLHRPWPPHARPTTNSHLGGLPRLPEGHAWPRNSRGTPFHFLAQIDCADLPIGTPLPERGVLFFFGRNYHQDTLYGERPVSDTCRVLYAPDSFARTPPRQPPADLPPLRYPGQWPNVHPAWPVVPLRFDSFPGGDALPEGLEIGADVREAYDAQLAARRAAALVAATGARPPGRAQTWREASAAVFDFAALGPQSFPQHWACVHHLARAILDRPPSFASSEEKMREMAAEAERWLGRAREGPLDRPVAEDDRQALRTWLAGLDDLPGLVFQGAVGTIWAWACDRALAALVPDHVYAACAPVLYGYDEDDPQFSQMLGHTPAPHVVRQVDDPTVCLLNLDTDRALRWYMGEGAQYTFWISPDDLARRDFSKVLGTFDGDGH